MAAAEEEEEEEKLQTSDGGLKGEGEQERWFCNGPLRFCLETLLFGWTHASSVCRIGHRPPVSRAPVVGKLGIVHLVTDKVHLCKALLDSVLTHTLHSLSLPSSSHFNCPILYSRKIKSCRAALREKKC